MRAGVVKLVERHADVIDLHEHAPFGDRRQVVDIAMVPLMANDDVTQLDALFLEQVHLIVGQLVEQDVR